MPKKEKEKTHLFQYATLYEVGETWAALFSDSQKVCDLVNHEAKKEWSSKLEALEYIGACIQPIKGTVFASVLDEHGVRQGFWLKEAGRTLSEALDIIRAQVEKLKRDQQEKRKRLGLSSHQ